MQSKTKTENIGLLASSTLCLSTNWFNSMHTFYLSYLHYELRNLYRWMIYECIKILFKYMFFHIYFQINKIPSLFLSLKVKKKIGNKWAWKFSATNRILVIGKQSKCFLIHLIMYILYPSFLREKWIPVN